MRTEGDNTVLNAKKLEAIKLLYEGNLTDAEIAKKIKRSRSTIATWKNDPEFRQALSQQGSKAMARLTNKAVHELSYLLDHAKSDTAKLKAIELILKANGLLDDPAKAELTKAKAKQAEAEAALAKNQANQSNIELRSLMSGLTTSELRQLAKLA